MQNKFLHLVIFLFLTTPLYSLSGASNNEIVNDESQTENSHVMVEIIDWYSNVSTPEIKVCVKQNVTDCNTITLQENVNQNLTVIFSITNSSEQIILELNSSNITITPIHWAEANLTFPCSITQCDGLTYNTFGQLNQSNNSFVEISLVISIGDFGDDDSDGILNDSDDCPNSAGTSFQEFVGCPDDDLDGYSNSNDNFPNNINEWLDNDGDGVGNNADICPNLSQEVYCGTNGDYIPVTSFTFDKLRNYGPFVYENMEISPNGELLAMSVGYNGGCDEWNVSGLIIIRLSGLQEYDFCDATPLIYMEEHSNAKGNNNIRTQLSFNPTGDELYYVDDKSVLVQSPIITYDTKNWSKIGFYSNSDFNDIIHPQYMLTNNGTNISYRSSSTSFTISYPDGEIKNVELGDNGDRPYILPHNLGYTEITDDSQSILVGSKKQLHSSDRYWVAINSTLSLYNLTTTEKTDIQLPRSLQDNDDSYFYGAQISSNGLRIIVHYGDPHERLLIYERDRDRDGFVDSVDLCPDIVGEFLGCNGENVDTDNDGVNENEDKCPNTKIGEKVGTDGCSSSQVESNDDNKSLSDSEIMFYSVLSVVIFIGLIVFKPQQTMSAVAGVTESTFSGLGIIGTLIVVVFVLIFAIWAAPFLACLAVGYLILALFGIVKD